MSALENTQSAIYELTSNWYLNHGDHQGTKIKVGVSGDRMGEIPYDPAEHLPQHINYFSPMGLLTGKPYVRLVRPKRALKIQIIEDRSTSDDDQQITLTRQKLTETLSESIADSRSGISDRVIPYVIYDSTRESGDQFSYDNPPIDSNLGSEFVSSSVADICSQGLTFIISNFVGLNLDDQSRGDFEETVAIKANVPAELKMTVGPKIWVGGEWLDTKKEKKLAQYHAGQDMYNQQIRDRLEAVGMSVAQVIFSTDLDNGYGFDVSNTDDAIAAAVRKISGI